MATIKQILKLRKQRLTLAEIAERLGCKRDHVHWKLYSAGIRVGQLPARFTHWSENPERFPDSVFDQILSSYFVRMESLPDIAKQFGLASRWVVRMLIYSKRGIRRRGELGFSTRSPKRPDKEFLGKRFNLLRVIRRDGRTRLGMRRWLCRCKCGNRTTANTHELTGGYKKSCGCLKFRCNEQSPNFKHGRYSKRLKYTQNSYTMMLYRCLDETCISYKHYAGKGVKVCQRWRESFLAFVEDMGRRPKDKSLDRLDPFLNYSCGHCEECLREGWTKNCKWSTDNQQRQNRRTDHEPPSAPPDSQLDDLGNELNPF